ncbi:hypothetical protein N027_15145 [Pseudomonas syringae USA007]|uniref:DUF7716 domain-containing protein n=1 Tax=Pseudomonas syringae USA007 TaxID=1357288 RepID=A0AAU8M3Q7_PSESX|nr:MULTISPECIES: hypothetical protein [Pseudomonas syringae group]
MFKLSSFLDTVEAIAACADDREVWDRYSWVYVQERTSLRDSAFYLVSRDDEDDEPALEAFAAQHDLCSFLEAATFADVLSVQKRQQPFSRLDDYAAALEHYAEQDAFLEIDDVDETSASSSGLACDLYAEFDLYLADCSPDRIGAAARLTAALLEIDIASALRNCRQLPFCLGERINRTRCENIEARYAEISVALRRVARHSFPWQAN